MRRREEHSNVRPLSPEDDQESIAPGRLQPGAWLAPAVGSVVLLIVLIVFGAGGANVTTSTIPEQGMVGADVPRITVTTTTLPPRLGDILPVPTERLVAISRSADPRTLLWPPSERFARSYRLQIEPWSASFDATGESVAFLDSRSTLYAGPMPGDAASQIEEMVSSARFHPSATAELAYTAAAASPRSTGLYRMNVTPGLLGAVTSEMVAELPAGSRLLTWGDWGYALALDTIGALLVLDPEGAPLRAMSGVAYAAGGDAILVDAQSAGIEKHVELTALAPDVVNVESEVGIVDSRFDPIWMLPGAHAESLNVTISPDGLHLALTTFTNTGGTSVTIRDRSDSTLRTLRLDSLAHPIGFVLDGDILAMQDTASGQLVFVDWRTGAHHRIEGVTGDFLAVDL
ncbi:MAG: hypothetical protein ABFS21_01920 [Actinomycetota bacterium]